MTDIGLGNARPQKAKKAKQPTRRSPKSAPVTTENPPGVDEFRASVSEPVDSRTHIPNDLLGEQVPPTPKPPANPYAVTGWRKRELKLFDLELPSGQICCIRRLERDDLLRLDLLQYLDTFTPMLLQDSLPEAERESQMAEAMKENPEALQKMLKAIDKVIMAACVKPAVTEDPELVNYGTESDWGNPDFTPVALLDDIDTVERMYIFGAAFGRDMDDLKSLLQQAQGVGGVANVPGVQQDSQ